MNKDRKLEPAQAQAAYTLDSHVSVTAGPGAGKTTVLVERYLHILREKKPASIDQIVAITFTNRAANEMRERLRKSLDDLLRQTSGGERDRWMRYKRTLDGAVITTIHGFCMRLLREFPVEAGLDPQFMLLDEHRSATLLAAACEEALSEAIGRRDESVSRLTAGIGRPLLATALFEIYLRVRGQGLAFEKISMQTAEYHSANLEYDSLCDEVEAAMSDLISTRGLTPGANEKRAEAERQWPRVKELLRQTDVSLAEYCGAISELREAARPKALGRVGSLVKRLDDLFWGESKEKCFGQLPQLRFDLVAKDYAIALVELLKSIDRRFSEKKQELSSLDFDDLQLRTLELLQRPEVLQRASQRYKFFLVDEFQDTNGLQRDLLQALVLNAGARANLFIVGDRKQSIYGFRGADVDVFGRTSEALQAAGGITVPLPLNFRSQPQLINFFNHFFARFFSANEELTKDDLSELGFVEHELSEARRDPRDQPPLVELLVDIPSSDDDPKWKMTLRERDAKQLVKRIIELTSTAVEPTSAGKIEYRDIALLFRAMTDVPVYEAEFRRAGIPFQTVLGKGFYEREEIGDLIQLCRFLDNRTDELALAAVLRSPLCGISDNTLLALRLAPRIGETLAAQAPQPRRHPRPLFKALARQHEIDFIAAEEREALTEAHAFLKSLIERRNRYPVSDLLRYAVQQSGYTTVVAANYDGAQRLANIEKLFNLAERFERSGAHLIRDFVKYVHDFEAIGSRESEGQLDDSANAIKIMTIHQAKGLEFPVVIIPDLNRLKPSWEGYFLLDRHRGLTLKVPNGRGQMVSGRTFTTLNQRSQWRDNFESMRLLYVAATRAQDRLILSGAAKDTSRLLKGDESWLQLIWQALELGPLYQSTTVELGPDTMLRVIMNLGDAETEPLQAIDTTSTVSPDLNRPLSETFPLLQSIAPKPEMSVHRFSVTQLINYQRCPRQYYFDRVLHLPSPDQMAVWNDAEAPEPPANLTATLKGAVIHRFCELYSKNDDAEELLRRSFADVLRIRQAELADRLVEINAEAAIADLFPLAQNYLNSGVFERVEKARELARGNSSRQPNGETGLWSEVPFRLRRPLGILTGAIDKLLIVPAANGSEFDIEIVDFKTNRMRRDMASSSSLGSQASRPQADQVDSNLSLGREMRAGRPRSQYLRSQSQVDQFAFNFEPAAVEPEVDSAPVSVADQVKQVASDYRLQMQAYALAVRELAAGLNRGETMRATLHFLEPNLEFQFSADVLTSDACMQAIDDAMMQIVSSAEPEDFPVRPAHHCRMCSFLGICTAGREWVRSMKAASKVVAGSFRSMAVQK